MFSELLLVKSLSKPKRILNVAKLSNNYIQGVKKVPDQFLNLM